MKKTPSPIYRSAAPPPARAPAPAPPPARAPAPAPAPARHGHEWEHIADSQDEAQMCQKCGKLICDTYPGSAAYKELTCPGKRPNQRILDRQHTAEHARARELKDLRNTIQRLELSEAAARKPDPLESQRHAYKQGYKINMVNGDTMETYRCGRCGEKGFHATTSPGSLKGPLTIGLDPSTWMKMKCHAQGGEGGAGAAPHGAGPGWGAHGRAAERAGAGAGPQYRAAESAEEARKPIHQPQLRPGYRGWGYH
jgi:hypothetical protein